MKKRSIVPWIGLLAIAGCSKAGNLTASTSPGAAPANVVGEWKGEILSPKDTKSNDLGTQFGKALGSMFSPRLDLNADGTFKMIAFMFPIEGHYTVQGNTIDMKPEKLMGKTKDELEQLQKSSPENMMLGNLDESFKDESVQIGKGGTELTFPSSKGDSEPLVFHKAPPEPVRKSTVTATEAPLVGQWSGKMDTSDMNPQSEKDKAAMEMAQVMAQNLSLDLRQDNTFEMNAGMDFEGKWTSDGKTVSINMSFGGMSDNSKPELGTLSNGGKTLTIDGSDGKGKMVFTKT